MSANDKIAQPNGSAKNRASQRPLLVVLDLTCIRLDNNEYVCLAGRKSALFCPNQRLQARPPVRLNQIKEQQQTASFALSAGARDRRQTLYVYKSSRELDILKSVRTGEAERSASL